MHLPTIFLESLEGIKGFDRASFEKAHAEPEQVTSIRMNPEKGSKANGQWSMVNSERRDRSIHHSAFTIHEQVPWSEFGYYLQTRPFFTFDPLFHAGCYYVQEASSMFLEQAFKQLVTLDQPLKLLDLCAAPGGKSTHIASLISSDSLLVSNEVIRNRVPVLKDNIIKWGCRNVVVTNNDAAAFQRLPGYFDVIVVDAPCSGSGLFRRDEAAISEWSLNNVQLCSQRQQRILADVIPALKEQGILIYSTCSYSREEDEEIMDWLVQDFGMENLELNLDEWNIVTGISEISRSKGYRFYPDRLRGEGFFIAAFRKTEADGAGRTKAFKPDLISAKEKSIIAEWIDVRGLQLLKQFETAVAMPDQLVQDYYFLRSQLNVQYAGVSIGQVMKDKLVPDHALALSSMLNRSVPFTELSYDESISYLQRREMSVTPAVPGWQTVRYMEHNLGWINALKNRINNYYPKELRILKQYNDRESDNL